jgi:hypothetical protein
MKKDFSSQEVRGYCRIIFYADATHCRRASGFQLHDSYAAGMIKQYFFN